MTARTTLIVGGTSGIGLLPDDAREDYFAAAAKALPVGRVATADDVAEVVVLAATNGNLTGTVIEADGGMRLVPLG
jgi:NAD(P)-dependent dehydrogenase (short-subunit alcohol dehydrogenase family)